MESKASYHRGECLAFVTCLIRHFSLVCLLAVLIFSPKASFATTVQGTTAYSSSAEAQTQINTLIAADIAAHPGASRSGNSVQWEEGSYDVKMRTSRNYSIRTGITGYGGYTSGNVYEVGAFVGGGQQIGATNNLAGPYPVSMSGYSTLVAARAAMQAYLQDVVYASLPSTVPHPIYPAFPMAKQPISAWIYWPNTYSLTVQYLDTTHNFARYVAYTGIYFQLQTPWYIDYQDTGSQLFIYLSDGTSTEPGKSLPFAATVKNQDGSASNESVTVNISLKVDPKSGGHDHGDSTRPRGKLSGNACLSDATCLPRTTNGSGVASFSFDAPDASGTHTITATCESCTNSPQTAEIDVKVDGLKEIPAAPTFYTFIGKTNEHSDNHYLTPEAASVLWRMAASYSIEQRFKVRNPTARKLVPPPVLELNDASLVWGGKFDIAGKWVGDHKGHKKGIVIDIRMNSTLGSVPINKYEAFKIMASESYGADAQAHCSKGFSFIKDQCKGDTNRHIHMLLFLGKDG